MTHLSVVPEEEVPFAPPRGLVGLAEVVVRGRHEIALATRRGATMTSIAATLTIQDRAATVTAREPNGIEWTISVSAVEASRP